MRMGRFDRTKITKTALTASVDNQELVVLRHEDDEMWVDPMRNYLPLRYAIREKGEERWVVEVSYKEIAHEGWKPASWRSSLLYQGDVWQSSAIDMTHCTINQPVPQSEFAPQLPIGTWVQNIDTKDTYILRENNERRPVRKGEFDGRNYKTLLETDPMDVETDPTYRLRFISVSLAVLGVLILAVLFWKRRDTLPR